jgi:heme exporter protein B
MRFLNTVFTVFMKDLKIEHRSKEIVSSTILFSLLVVLLSAFAFGLNTVSNHSASAGVLWIALSFSGLLGLSRTYLREREMNVWRAVLMLPVSRGALYLGKMLGVFTFLLIVALVLVPIIELFFHAPMLAHLHLLLPIILLALLGFSAIGTLFGAMTIHTRLRDILLGVILYPLVSPILIAAVKGTEAVLMGDGITGAGDYFELLVVVDIIYIVGGFWLFGPLMED